MKHTVVVAIALLSLGPVTGRALAQAVPPAPPAAPSSPLAPAPAGDAVAPSRPGVKLDPVEVTGQRDPTQERRYSTAAKIVIGREEIEEFGDMTLADVMKRLPSVSVAGRPGRGGQIRMRGMGNGYTQILIDGERIPRGFSIDQISPDMVERIEIYRAPTAETGARAIAGTINIILREPLRQSGDDVRAGATEERGRVQPNLSWTHNDVIGEKGTWNLTVSTSRSHPKTDTATDTTFTSTATGLPDQFQALRQTPHDEKYALHVTGRLQWNFAPGDQIALQPFLSLMGGQTQVAGTLAQPFGILPPPYATSESTGDSRSNLVRLVAMLKKRLGESTRIEVRANVGTFKSNSNTILDEYGDTIVDLPSAVLDQRTSTSINDRSWSLTGKLFQTLGEHHSVVAGLEAEGVDRDENTLTLVNGTPSVPGFGGDVTASTLRLAGYAQDEWTASPRFAANAGLRWESISAPTATRSGRRSTTTASCSRRRCMRSGASTTSRGTRCAPVSRAAIERRRSRT